MAKTYKNVYTIFEKVKRGELDTVTSDRPSLFSNIRYNIRNELIKPHLHYIDEKTLQRSIRQYMRSNQNHQELVEIAKKHNKKLPAPDDLYAQVEQIYENFPKELINDIFNMYHKDIHQMDFEKRTASNKFRYKMIEKSNNPVTKVMTQSSHLKSMVFTRNFIQSYILQLAMLEQEDKESFDEVMKQLQQQGGQEGEGQGQGGQGQGGDEEQQTQGQQQGQGTQSGSSKGQDNNGTPEQQLEKLMNSAAAKKIHDTAMEKAKNTTQMMDQVMNQQEQEKAWEDISSYSTAGEKALNKTNPVFLEKMERELKQVGLSMNSIKNKIKDLLDRSVSYFSARDYPVYESIFDADSMDGIMNMELLHPALRKCCIEDVQVKDVKKLGKIDIYLDMSGSMSSSCGVRNNDGHLLTKTMFAKAFAYKMKEMDMLNEVYSFQGTVKFEGTELVDILAMSDGGSTNLNAVVHKINQNRRNAIVITDAEDYVSHYSDKAFFIGVQGSRFDHFSPEALQQYREAQQLCVFDGSKIYSVNEAGCPIV